MTQLAPFGFQAGQSRRSVNEYYVPASDTFEYAVGDVVKTNGNVFVGRLPDSRITHGMLHVAKAASGQAVRGVVVGIAAGPGANNEQSVPAAKTRAYSLLVNDNPQALWDAQADNAAPLSVMAGVYANYTVAAPSGSVSATRVNSASIGANVGDLLIAEVLQNDGANSLLRVAFVQHELAYTGWGTCTLATLPTASANTGRVIYVSDVGGGIYVRSNGTRWLPLNGNALLYEVPATEPTSSTAAETVVVALPLPIGLWANGDTLQVTARVSKSGSSDSHTFISRIGTSTTAVGTSTGWSAVQPATTNRFALFMFNLKRVSATSIKPGTSGAGFTGTSTTVPTAVTVPNMDTQQTYLQLTSTITGGGGETVTWENARVEWIPAYA